MAPTKTAVAATARRIQAGTRTAESRAIAPAASSESSGASANQSTCGVWITSAEPLEERLLGVVPGERALGDERGPHREREQARHHREHEAELADAQVERLGAH